ncbi:interferon alpha/beta receptor 1b isoform X1 [Esox lucius]|uniref:interferon alpha/beta receptor 1b isoform X1 n=1 Tax=Esox lucius TaxID=8010 RepID=UPI001476C6B5|nr:interferon alpha/beta receptor 1b isoform X1 [Esox lucius]
MHQNVGCQPPFTPTEEEVLDLRTGRFTGINPWLRRIFIMLLLFATTNVLGEVPVPQNVTLSSMNTQYILIWDWDQNNTGSPATFTAEYIAKFKLARKKSPPWVSVCNGTTATFCDFTGSDLLYLGMYVFRVQASVDGLASEWVQKDFCPHKDAVLGPPSRVELAPAGNLLDVCISPPLTSTQGSMSDLLALYYRIEYWSQWDDPQGLKREVLNTSSTLVTLPGLDAWSWYCVTVQARYDYYNKASRYIAPMCMQTEGDTPHWQIFLYFLIALVVCFLLVLLLCYTGFRCYKVLKNTFYPSNQLPYHIQEYLSDSPSSDLPCLLTPDSELCCDRLSVCPEVVLLEVHVPPPVTESEQDGGRHIRQGSGDSGMYSTEGGSAQQHCCSSAGSEPIGRDQEVDSWQMAEKVQMEEIGKTPVDGVVDEGVGDLFGHC